MTAAVEAIEKSKLKFTITSVRIEFFNDEGQVITQDYSIYTWRVKDNIIFLENYINLANQYFLQIKKLESQLTGSIFNDAPIYERIKLTQDAFTKFLETIDRINLFSEDMVNVPVLYGLNTENFLKGFNDELIRLKKLNSNECIFRTKHLRS